MDHPEDRGARPLRAVRAGGGADSPARRLIDPGQILALKGDAGRGRAIFTAESVVNCKSCHRLDGVGESRSGPTWQDRGEVSAAPNCSGRSSNPPCPSIRNTPCIASTPAPAWSTRACSSSGTKRRSCFATPRTSTSGRGLGCRRSHSPEAVTDARSPAPRPDAPASRRPARLPRIAQVRA